MNAPLFSRPRAAAAVTAALLVLTGAGRASADVMQVTYEGRGAGVVTTFQYNHQDDKGFIGQYNMQVVGGAPFESFCVDPAHAMFPGVTITVQPRSTNDGLNQGPQIAYLYNTYGQSVLTDNSAAAGLQLAIWKLVVDGPDDDLSTGNFQYNPGPSNFNVAAYNDALFYLSQAASHAASAVWLDAAPSQLLGRPAQSVLAPDPPDPPDPPPSVPEPTSALLVGLGLAGLAVYRRRRRGMPDGHDARCWREKS